jgi:hypothetical protein
VAMTTKPRSSARAGEPASSRGGRVPALGYARVSAKHRLDGPEAEAQRRAIEDGCRELGLELIDVVRDQEREDSGAHPRPGLLDALERIDAGEAACLIVSNLERLSGSAAELDTVLNRLERQGRRLVAVDVGLDTATAPGQLAVATRPGVRPARGPELEALSRAAGAPGTPLSQSDAGTRLRKHCP